MPAPPGAGCRGGGVLAGGPRCAALGDPSAPAMPCEQREGAAAPARYVVGVDVGSTVLKCHVYDQAAAVRGSSCKKVNQGRGAGGAAAEPCAARPRGEGCPAPGGIGGRRQPQPVGRAAPIRRRRKAFTGAPPALVHGLRGCPFSRLGWRPLLEGFSGEMKPAGELRALTTYQRCMQPVASRRLQPPAVPRRSRHLSAAPSPNCFG